MPKKARSVIPKAAGEPELTGGARIELITALNWYNYNSDPNDYKIWLKDFVKANSVDRRVGQKVVNHSKSFRQTWAAIARLESRGFNTGYKDRLLEYMKSFAADQQEDGDDTDTTTKAAPPTIRERLENACTPYFSWIDQQVDNFVLGKPYNDNFYDYLTEQGCGAAHARVIRNDYQAQFDELRLLASGDKDVAEYYQIYGKRGQKLLIDIFVKLENDLLQFEQTKKTQRVRKVKKPSVEKIIKHVKYCKESPEYKIGSIQPVKVLGSDQLWVFNTKTRQLGCYVGSNLTFQRSSLKNFDEELSVSKKLRKPEDVLKVITDSSKTKCTKLFDSIKAKAKPMNGRITDTTILIKVF